MKLKNLHNELKEEVKKPQVPTNIKTKLVIKLKDLLNVTEAYENSYEIKKNELDKFDTLKKFMHHFLNDLEKTT